MAVSSDVQLRIYNEALRILGERQLASVTEDREPQRVLTEVWGGSDEVVKRALFRADWNFAMRSAESAYDPSRETGFGFRYVHDKPDDLIRLSSLAADPYFSLPLTAHQYGVEGETILTDHATLYIRYVSKGDAYGLDAGNWPEDFREYLAAYLAFQSAARITSSDAKVQEAEARMTRALRNAKSIDAMNEGVKFPPAGNWRLSRQGGWGRDRSRWDGTTR